MMFHQALLCTRSSRCLGSHGWGSLWASSCSSPTSYLPFSASSKKEGDSNERSSGDHRQHGQAGSTSAVDLVKRKLGLQLEGMSFQLPRSPLRKGRLGPQVDKLVLYRGRGMLPFRFLVRAKVFQLLGFMASATMLTAMAGTNQGLSTTDMAIGASVIVGCVVTSYCIWFYSGRYVGELSLLLPAKRVARFSVLDFWGNREDNDTPIELIDPPFLNRSVAEVKAIVSQQLMPISVIGDRQYYISPRHGYLLQKDVLNKICYGKWLDELDGKIPPMAASSGKPSPGLPEQHRAFGNGRAQDKLNNIQHPSQGSEVGSKS